MAHVAEMAQDGLKMAQRWAWGLPGVDNLEHGVVLGSSWDRRGSYLGSSRCFLGVSKEPLGVVLGASWGSWERPGSFSQPQPASHRHM